MKGNAVSPHGAVEILRQMVRRQRITVRDRVFRYEPFGEMFRVSDIKECLIITCENIDDRAVRGHKGWRSSSGIHALDFWTDEKLFELLFKELYVQQKLYPVQMPDSGPGPLPTLFIGAEKTQVRQIPLADERPWPFKFLLELGGMIVCKTENKRDLLMELRQYLLNFPQFRIKVHAEEWPTGETLIVTTWFQQLKLMEKK